MLFDFLNDNLYKKIIFVFLAKVTSSVIGFSTTIILVKSLGGDVSSDYFFLISLVSFLTAVSTFGCPDAILKIVAVNKLKGILIKYIVRNSCLLSIVFSLLISVLLYLLGNVIHLSTDKQFIISIFMILPLASLSLILSSALQGRGFVVLSMVTSGILQNLFLLCSLILFKGGYLDAVISFALGNLTACLVAGFFFIRNLKLTNGHFDKSEFHSMCSSMFISQCIVQYNNNSAVLLLGFFWLGSDLSIIAISLKLTTLLSFIIISVNKVLAPKIASTYKKGNILSLQELITKSSRLMWGLCLPAVLFLMFFSKDILAMIDPSYKDEYLVLVILAVGQLVNVITGNIGLLLSMTGHEKVQRNILLISLVLSLVLGAVLIPNLGPLGASIMVSTTVVLVNVSSYVYVLVNLKINTLKLL
ncbi:oligosaccharide flippase family protein [Vibrio cyclitrophicus]|uniref:oligosaccharide flippase family protein n=1 Tax=Vibrio cyclitrophicus TaxID=47951 RepID=UPI0013000B3E|nr:oligosaccharide flippase family protein [Vibrio cyclitrophicus]